MHRCGWPRRPRRNAGRGTRCDGTSTRGGRLARGRLHCGECLVERHDRAPVAGFYWTEAAQAGDVVRLPEEIARHAHVRRLRPGAPVRLTDGKGRLSLGEATEVGAKQLVVAIS